MQVREDGGTGEADLAQGGASAEPLARPHAHAVLGQVAILRLPAVGVADHHPVAAQPVADRRGARGGPGDVLHAVAHARHHAVGGRQRVHAGALSRKRGQPEVCAIMTVVGQRPTLIVAGRRRGVMIDILLDLAAAPELAGKRQVEHDPILRASRHQGLPGHRQNEADRSANWAHDHGFPASVAGDCRLAA